MVDKIMNVIKKCGIDNPDLMCEIKNSIGNNICEGLLSNMKEIHYLIIPCRGIDLAMSEKGWLYC